MHAGELEKHNGSNVGGRHPPLDRTFALPATFSNARPELRRLLAALLEDPEAGPALAASALAPPRGLTPLHALRAEGVAGGDALAEAACIAAWGLQDWAVELGELMASVLAARADELSRLTVRPCLWRRRGAGSPL